MKFWPSALMIVSFLISCGYVSATEEEKPNDMYQWQVQKYPKVKKGFPILVDENSSITEKPANINYKVQDKIKQENLRKKRKEIEIREEKIIEEDNRLMEQVQKGKTSKTEEKTKTNKKEEKKASKKEEKKSEKTTPKEQTTNPLSDKTPVSNEK